MAATMLRPKANFPKLLTRFLAHPGRRGVVSSAVDPEEYTDKPEYPPILDLSFKARRQRKREELYEEMRNVETVEEKLIKINMPRYYGFKSTMLSDERIPYDSLEFSQHITRTDFKEVERLPIAAAPGEGVDALTKEIVGDVQDEIGFQHEGYSRDLELNRPLATGKEREEFVASNLVQAINRIILNGLRTTLPHLADVEVDVNPRHEAFWHVGGILPPKRIEKWRKSHPNKDVKAMAGEPVDRNMQYVGRPYLAVRHQMPLEPIVKGSVDALDFSLDGVTIPNFQFDPATIGYKYEHRHGTSIPGFWPGDRHEFGLISYQRLSHFLGRTIEGDRPFALQAQAIQSSFAWLFSQACYQGFSTYNDVAYPLVTQTVLTDGRDWSFYAYQLNTTLVTDEFVTENPRYNQCWGLPEARLYEEVDASGKVIGFNEDVLRTLVQFYANQPKARDHEMTPCLLGPAKRAAEIEHNERRQWIEKTFKHLMSNRPRYRLAPETYLWEKFYKIDHKKMPLAKKLKPFEFGINPYNRKLNEHQPAYIPKVLRPEGPKSKKKWANTYWP